MAMQLRDYRKWKGLTIEAVSVAIGQSKMNISRHERGLAHVDALTREKYRTFTGGAVTPDDWHRLELEALSPLKAASPHKPKEAAVHG